MTTLQPAQSAEYLIEHAMDKSLILLSFIVFLPAAGALLLACIPTKLVGVEAIRYITLAVTGAVFATLVLAMVGPWGGDDLQFQAAQSSMQQVFSIPWIPSFDISYYMGLDGISFPYSTWDGRWSIGYDSQSTRAGI